MVQNNLSGRNPYSQPTLSIEKGVNTYVKIPPVTLFGMTWESATT